MANSWTLSDGTTNLALNNGTAYFVTGHRMGTPDYASETVTDTLELVALGASLTAATTNIRALEAMLEAARRRQIYQSGPRVYLTVQWDGQSDAWRAEVTDGQMEAAETAGQLWRKVAEVTLVLTRRAFEGVDWVQLTLTNSNGTDNTSGLNVYNANDGSGTPPTQRRGYATIDAAEVTGALPAPVKLKLTNNSGGSMSPAELWVSNNVFNDPVNFAYVLEGEDRVTGSGTITAAGDASGGQYNLKSINGVDTLHWALSAALVTDMAGMPFRVILETYSAPIGYVTAQIRDESGLTVLAEGQEVQLDNLSTLVDLGILFIPPGGTTAQAGPLRFALKWRTSSAVNATIDYLLFLPAATTRNLYQRGMALANGMALVLDESEGRAYALEADGDEQPWLIMRGRPLLLTPGRTQRLYFAWMQQGGLAPVTERFAVQAWFRPRRWTV